MMKDKLNFVWNKTYQKVFDDIKSEIAKRPTLSAYNSWLNIETILTTNVSQYGLEAVLSKVSNGVEQPIIFVSRTLSDAEKNYSVIEKETLAVHWAMQWLRTFIWGRRFTVQTDHKPHRTTIKILSKKKKEKNCHRPRHETVSVAYWVPQTV